jgi:hypothetical protein
MGKLFDVPTITCTIFKITIFNKTDSFYQKKKLIHSKLILIIVKQIHIYMNNELVWLKFFD